MKTKIYRIFKGLALCLLVAAFFAPFPIPYLYKLDRQLVGEGKFISYSAHYEPRAPRYNVLVQKFRYFNQMRGREEVLDMSVDDNSTVGRKTLTAGQHVYVYAMGPLKWTAATSVKDDLRGVFFMRVLLEFSVRTLFCALILLIFGMFKNSESAGGGGLSSTSMLLFYGGTQL